MKFNKIFVVLAILLLVIILFLLSDRNLKQKVVTVDCDNGDNGETLRTKVAGSNKGDVINVLGTCKVNSPVVVGTSNILINGQGATIDGGDGEHSVIEVRGAKNVIISGLTLARGKHGIFIDEKSSVALSDINARNNSSAGIAIGADEFEFAPETSEGGLGVQQSLGDTQKTPLTEILNKLDFSFISQAVADCHDVTLPDVSTIIKTKNIIGFKLCGGGTSVVYGTVTVNGSGNVGVHLESSLLVIIDNLIIRDKNLAGMVVSEGSVVRVYGRVDEQGSDFGLALSTYVGESKIRVYSGVSFNEKISCYERSGLNNDVTTGSIRELTCQ
ncbi:MAG: hypothetical protein L3J70_12150 [Gammaproteobacteria bacterium]|nr:hypothetical protein [Gammaproteobacteria bacterium]